jgi:hypothetical protein
VERHACGEDKLDLEPGQVAAYLESSRVEGVVGRSCSEQGIFSCRTHGRQELSGPTDPPDKCKTCRGCETLEREDIMELESIDGADVEIEVSIIFKKITKNANAF